MEISDNEAILHSLLIAFCIALVWLIVALLAQAFRILRGSPRYVALLPAWLRLAILTALSSVSFPRAAQAAPSVAAGATGANDSGHSDVKNLLLAGSIAANAGFAAIHVRRRLVQIRAQKFGAADKEERPTLEANVVVPERAPDWSVLVHVLGPPVVTTSEGKRVLFEKGKALELLVWMTEHRETSTRSAARTALWDGMVKDSTFSNVVSEVRRSLNSCHTGEAEDWIPRTFTDELPLHHGIVTDAELLEIAMRNFEHDRGRFAAELIQHLSEVRNLPFSGADYAWADGEGITTSHVIKVVRAAVLVGEYAIEQGDNDLLFMATERGLRVLPGHEQLIALRMRGHACSGNRTAIKYEWESYARAIEADSWAGAVPSSELEKLARELASA